ncbi:unnamed protein product [Toxocara canis]|uniref:Ground-like domain-containing protein n=1 Tax=Toxocara canis TaxID=6265 RepID=A0A183UWL3_TOXCA|nr:unnamed protein product [Toxocara canis]
MLQKIFGFVVLLQAFGEASAICACATPCVVPVCPARPPPCPPPVVCPPRICPPPPPCPPLPAAPPCPPCPRTVCPVCAPRPLPIANECCITCAVPCTVGIRKKRSVEEIAFSSFTSNNNGAICNNNFIRNVIIKNIVNDTTESKRRIQRALAGEYAGRVNVVCAEGDISYVAFTGNFCQATKNGISCYVFQPL